MSTSLLLVVSAAAMALVAADSCLYKVQGYTYNMTSLRNSTNDYVVTDDKNHEYYMNFCGPLLQFPVNITACSDSNETQICQVWDSGQAGVSCGKSNRVNVEREFFRGMSSLTVHIRGGTPRFGVNAKSVVHLVCNGTASDPAPEFSHEVLHDFEYHFLWRRAEVCAGPSPPPTTAPPPTTTSPPPSPTSADSSTSSAETTTQGSSDGSSGSGTEHSGRSHSSHSHTTSNETLSSGGSTTAVNGTTVAVPAGPEVIDVRLIIVLAVLGALVVVAVVVLVAVYLARRRKRLAGFAQPFERI